MRNARSLTVEASSLSRAKAPRGGAASRLVALAACGLVASVASIGSCACEEELYLRPGALRGNLCSVETGQPLSSHPVRVESEREVVEVTTDLFGRYEVGQVSPGTVLVRATVEGETRVFETHVGPGDKVELRDDQCRAPPPPPAPPTGVVSGCVCDEGTGRWVAGANVYIAPPSGNIVVTGTDDLGCFLLANAPVGSHTLKIDRGAFYREHAVEVVEGEETRIPTPDVCALPQPPPVIQVGNIEGRVCAPDGRTWLGEALVYVELQGGGIAAQSVTDSEGHYRLEGVPSGSQTVTVVKGSFTSTFSVDVPANDTVVLPDDECALDLDMRMAVVAGAWDDVRSVLINVGIDPANIYDFPASGWASQLLGNYEQLAEYDILFFNCGLNEDAYRSDVGAQGVLRDNLREFVANGGSVYASDQAYDIVERAFPEFIKFFGNDNNWDDAQRGFSQNSITGTVTDLALAAALGTNSLELHYPLPSWAVMESVASGVRVYVRANARVGVLTTLQNVPHTVGFRYGQGTVIYTSFHQEPGINQQMERVLQLLVFEL